MIKKAQIDGWICLEMDCGHEWLSKGEDPKRCPACNKSAFGRNPGRPEGSKNRPKPRSENEIESGQEIRT